MKPHSIRIEEADWEIIEQISKEERRSASNVVNIAIKAFIYQRWQQKKKEKDSGRV